jgi:hypothetical protein
MSRTLLATLMNTARVVGPVGGMLFAGIGMVHRFYLNAERPIAALGTLSCRREDFLQPSAIVTRGRALTELGKCSRPVGAQRCGEFVQRLGLRRLSVLSELPRRWVV